MHGRVLIMLVLMAIVALLAIGLVFCRSSAREAVLRTWHHLAGAVSLVIAQDAASSLHFDMPRAAIDTGCFEARAR
jgi:uncharacterized membrane protein YqiK